MPAGGGGHSVRVAALAVLRRTLQSQQPPPAAAAAAAAATVGAGAGTGGAGQLVALDVGTSKCGLAISAPGNMLAFPLGDYRRSQAVSQDAAYLRAVFVAHRTRALVVGLPIDHRGQEGAGDGLGPLIGPESVVYWDERLTTRMVNKRTVQEHGRRPRDIKRDAGAAALILQEVLDSVRSGGASVGIGGAHR